jgi:mono/diheme cytochrome c family protein
MIRAVAVLAMLALSPSLTAQAPATPEAGVDHAALIRSMDGAALTRGQTIYQTMCVVCHGEPGKPGSLPNSRAFWKEPFKNGGDPYGIYQTLTSGLGQMPAMPMLSPAQRHEVAHYVREKLVKANNPSAYVAVDRAYLDKLPKPKGTFVETREMKEFRKGPKYHRMDFGPVMMWTLAADRGNIAQKGIAIRLDSGPGGISKGRAWMLYEHDTMRVAAAWTGSDFINWRNIAFNGAHHVHPTIVGDTAFTQPDEPAWADPSGGAFADTRFRGPDGKPYGPLPRAHLRYRGTYRHGDRSALFYQVGAREVLESPGCVDLAGKLVFTRTFRVAPGTGAIKCRIAAEGEAVTLRGSSPVRLESSGGHHLLHVPPASEALSFTVEIATRLAAPEGFAPISPAPEDLLELTRGGPPQWPHPLPAKTGPVIPGDGFEAMPLDFPDDATNPWKTQWRPAGLDFLADGKRLALCNWMGDVWIVSGIDDPGGDLAWRRIASGLHQPLGLKIVDDVIHITCRDQIVRLRDLNGDGETDFYECFNSDHQVTEHFHEFAMGLQTDRDGNFYYAKSGRHALPALVPQHGTLLKVSRDGSETTIIANGFRAANGICVNDDGTFWVTDQEGNWMPKNRVNLVKPGGFYGNMWSYGAPEDTGDATMEEPLVWITNRMNRSPGELVRVTSDKWTPLTGKLVDMSYGMGRMFLVLRDESDPAQGAVVAMPVGDFPTGVMRGRFHPASGDLFACGMAVWASNKHQDGGLYRVRRTAAPAHLPIAWATGPGSLRITFSDPLDSAAAETPASYQLTTWDIRRTERYGSAHLNESAMEIRSASVSPDKRTVTLHIPSLAPTRCLRLAATLKAADGGDFTREVHATIHRLESP